jgi:hypothetical protein
MININQNIISTLINDATLASLMSTTVPNLQINVGGVDIVKETQASLAFPMINLHVVSESTRTVPLNAKDTHIQLSIWSRVSELETENIYERVVALLNFINTTVNGTKIEWQRTSGATTDFFTDVSVWQTTVDFVVWSWSTP